MTFSWQGTTTGRIESTTTSSAKLLEAIRMAKERLAHLQLDNLTVVESSAAPTMRTPVVVHRKRRGQKESYHKRIQKKWNKRYGMVESPAIYVVDTGMLDWFGGSGQRLIVVPPHVLRKLRAACPQKFPNL